MKQFYTLLLAAIVLPELTPAQDLALNTPSAPADAAHRISAVITPEWTRQEDQINGRISSAKLSKMKTVNSSIINFFHDTCFSEGEYTLAWHGEFYSEKTSPTPLMKFGVSCHFSDPGASLTVTANDISSILQPLAVNNHPLYTMLPVRAIRNDCPYLEGTRAPEQDGARSTRTWLILRDNRELPYIPVTRQEYLQEAKAELLAIKAKMFAALREKMIPRPAAVQEAEKKATIDQLNNSYSGVDLQVRMRMFLESYKTDEDYLKENADKETADIDSTISVMTSILLHLPAQELKRPAMISGEAAVFQGFTDGQPDERMLVRINPAFVSGYSSTEAPQFFVLAWSFDPREEAAAAMDRQMQGKFDVQPLRRLLGR